MQWHEFIFSNQLRHRIARHSIFWLTWWWYFFFSTYWLRSPHNKSGFWETKAFIWNQADVAVSLLLLLIHIAACYTVIFFLLPQYLLKSKYLRFVFGMLLLGCAMAEISHFIYQTIFPLGESDFIPFSHTLSNTWWASISAGILGAIKVIAVAIAIKLLKRWWLKQKEKERLEREKINAELQLLKAQIHPAFLFSTLNNIYVYALAGSPRASEMLMKLSDLLSYMLYELDQPLVSLKKEIEMMKEYMTLEKIRLGDNLEMEIKTKGDLHDKMIAPFLLLPFIENGFKHCNLMPDKSWIILEIVVEETYYLIKLVNGIIPEMATQADHENGIANVQKRLNLLYPGKHELKIMTEQEMLVALLKIELEPRAANITPGIKSAEPATTLTTTYA